MNFKTPYCYFIVFLALVVYTGCKKQNACKDINLTTTGCVDNDTSAAYQLLAGKFYLRMLTTGAPLHGQTGEKCYTDNSNYLDFLLNRTVAVHGLALRERDTVMAYHLLLDSFSAQMYTNVPLLDFYPAKNIGVCENTIGLSNSYGAIMKSYRFSKN